MKDELIEARLKPLTSEETLMADLTRYSESSTEVIAEKFDIVIDKSKIRCMQPGTWLNDEIINFYIQMILQRDKALCNKFPERRKSQAFNSFFMDKLIVDSGGYNFNNVKKWTKKFDVFDVEKLYIPINISNAHWVLAVVFPQRKEVHFYDSMHGNGEKYLDALRRWLVDEAKKKSIDLDLSNWNFQSVGTAPLQHNGTDCGVFTIMAADFISDDLPVIEESYDHTNMSFFRVKIVNDILRGNLNYPLKIA